MVGKNRLNDSKDSPEPNLPKGVESRWGFEPAVWHLSAKFHDEVFVAGILSPDEGPTKILLQTRTTSCRELRGSGHMP